MTGEEFTTWRERMGYSRRKAAEALGIGVNQPKRYEEGQQIPQYIALACAALVRGLRPWPL